jgi:hypothetical protein
MKFRSLLTISAFGLSLTVAAAASAAQPQSYYFRLVPLTHTNCHFDDTAYAAPTPPPPPFSCDDGSSPTVVFSKMFASKNACDNARVKDQLDNLITPWGGVIHDYGCFEAISPIN